MAEKADAASKTYDGSCHCGKAKFTIQISPPLEGGAESGGEVSVCNCSICQRNGYLWVMQSEEDTVAWECGKDELTKYLFGKKSLGHCFCPVCGVSVCATTEPGSPYQGYIGINARTLQNLDIDLDKLKIKKMDGKSY